jgi:cell division septal protein FtsQ
VRHKREVIFGSAILIIATLAFLLGWTNLFTVQAVSVTGSPNSELTKQVLQISNVHEGEKLARIEPRNIASKLQSAGINWIESIKISRNWFTRKVEIKLNARTPIAKAGDSFIDQSGVLFTSPIAISAKLPEIYGGDQAIRSDLVAFYLSLPSDLKSKLSQLNASSAKNYQIQTSDGLRIIWGANSDNSLKIKIYKALLALPENSKIKLMDLSDPTKPTVK